MRVQAGSGEPSIFVFKGINFPTYLVFRDDDGEFARAMVEPWRRSSKLIVDMPPHPNGVLAWKPYCPVLSAAARSQTDGGDVSVLE